MLKDFRTENSCSDAFFRLASRRRFSSRRSSRRSIDSETLRQGFPNSVLLQYLVTAFFCFISTTSGFVLPFLFQSIQTVFVLQPSSCTLSQILRRLERSFDNSISLRFLHKQRIFSSFSSDSYLFTIITAQ